MKRVPLGAPVLEIEEGDAAVVSSGDAPAVEIEELVGVIEGQAPNQHGVHEGEDRGVQADPESECQRRDQREPGILDEEPAGVADVLKQGHLLVYERQSRQFRYR